MDNTSNYRKVIVGESFANSVKYVKGSKYRLGDTTVTLTNFVPNETYPNKVDIYVSDGGSTVRWKTIRVDTALDIEYDVNFQ